MPAGVKVVFGKLGTPKIGYSSAVWRNKLLRATSQKYLFCELWWIFLCVQAGIGWPVLLFQYSLFSVNWATKIWFLTPKTLNSTAGTTPAEEPIAAVTRWVGCTLDRSPACCSVNITLHASLKFLVYKISLAGQYLPICVSLGCGTSGWAVCWLYSHITVRFQLNCFPAATTSLFVQECLNSSFKSMRFSETWI